MNEIKISVIIPAYNCEKLIGDTLKSLQAQTLKEFEIIIINDGSTDKTLDVLEEFAKNDSRITLMNIKNSGPANARNLGINQAKGEYLSFFDSDDLADPNMLFEMYELALKNNLDVACCGYNMENISLNSQAPQLTRFGYEAFVALDATHFREKLMGLITAHVMYVVWNKLYKTEFIKGNKIYFQHYFSGEDRIFNITAFKSINRFGFIDKPFYRYFIRGQQTLANRYVENRFEAAVSCHEAFIQSYKDMDLYNDENAAYIDFAFIKMVMSCFTQLNSKGCKLSFAKKKAYIAQILSNGYVEAALLHNDSHFGYSKIVNSILKSNNKTLIYLTSKAIFIMQFKLNSLYLKIKHHVNQKNK